MILTKMKETAEAYLGKKVTHAVVTVPACSSSRRRRSHSRSFPVELTQFLPRGQTSTTPSARPPRTPARSPA
jgi:hypothetical protein